jgi:hypothetical protein
MASPRDGEETTIQTEDITKGLSLTVSPTGPEGSSWKMEIFMRAKSGLVGPTEMAFSKHKLASIRAVSETTLDTVLGRKEPISSFSRGCSNTGNAKRALSNTTKRTFIRASSKTTSTTAKALWVQLKEYILAILEKAYKTVMGSSNGQMGQYIVETIIEARGRGMVSFTTAKIKVLVEVFGRKVCYTAKVNTSNLREILLSVSGRMAKSSISETEGHPDHFI